MNTLVFRWVPLTLLVVFLAGCAESEGPTTKETGPVTFKKNIVAIHPRHIQVEQH